MARWAIVAAMLMFLPAGKAAAPEVVQTGPGEWAAGVQSAEFDFAAAPHFAGRQRQANWCWAACIQMVLNYHGLRVSQEDVVRRVYGAQVDLPAQPAQILAALSGWAPDARGRFSAIHASPYVASGSQIVRDLATRWPLIVGLRGAPIGHAYVLTAVHYRVNPYNNEPIFTKVVLRDPWPGNRSRVEMSWSDFQSRLTFMCRVSVSRL